MDPMPIGDPEAAAEAEREITQQWRDIAAQVSAQGRGDGAGGTLISGLITPPPSRVPWHRVLRTSAAQAIASHGRDASTWTRRSRRSGETGPILPGSVSYPARIAVMLDSSASVDGESLIAAIGHVLKLSQIVRARIYFLVHDHVIHWADWLKAGVTAQGIAACVKGRGGTDFDAALEKIGELREKFDVLIQLTDGECVWPKPAKPRNVKRLVVALIGRSDRTYLPPEARAIETKI